MNSEQNNDKRAVVDFDLFPEEEMIDVGSFPNLTVHIKHNWYSEDTDHGRSLLSSFMTALAGSSQKAAVLLLSGSAVKMLDDNDPLHDEFIRLSQNSMLTGACIESLEEYDIGTEDKKDLRITLYTATDLAFEILGADHLITLE